MVRKAPMSKVRVLICEDEGLTALRLQTSVAKLGYEVVGGARDGEEAVAAAARWQPDAILMDVEMPNLDGIAATREIMRAAPAAVLIVSAYGDQESIAAAMGAGASGYLVKPVTDAQRDPALAEALNTFVAGRPAPAGAA